jgi:hypothetical protein
MRRNNWMRRAFGAVLTLVLVTACSSPPAAVPASGGTTVTGPGELPSISAVWFGTAIDPATLALTDKASTFKAGTPLVAIGTLLAPRAQEEMSVTVETGGTVRHTVPVTAGVGNTYAADLTPLNLGPGHYLIEFEDSTRKSLASASVTITP